MRRARDRILNSRSGPGCGCRSRKWCRTSTCSCAAGRATSATATRPARFAKIRQYAVNRLALFIGKRHKRGRGFGLSVLLYMSPDRAA